MLTAFCLAAPGAALGWTSVGDLNTLQGIASNTGASIKITGDITLPGNLKIECAQLDFAPGCQLLKGAASLDLVIHSEMPNRPEKFFDVAAGTYEWEPGDITGRMGYVVNVSAGTDRMPEWWGGKPWDGVDDTRAINCAVGAVLGSTAFPPDAPDTSVPYAVQLGCGRYNISGPVILTNTRCTLKGRSSFNTELFADKNAAWTGHGWLNHPSKFSWVQRYVQPGPNAPTSIQTDINHVAMLYIGGGDLGANTALHHQKNRSFYISAGNDVNCVVDVGFTPLTQYGADVNRQTPNHMRMSYISTLHDSATVSSRVRPGTLIRNINAGGCTGYGVGFCQETMVNLFTLHGFHLNDYGPDAPDPGHPIFLPVNTYNTTIEKGTVGGGFHMRGTAPNDILDVIGIVAQGQNVKVSSVHVEHCHVGVDVIANPNGNPVGVDVTNVDYWCAGPQARWGPDAAVVRFRGPSSEGQAATLQQIATTVKTISSQNATPALALLYEPGAQFVNTTFPTKVLTYEGYLPIYSMPYYRRGWTNNNGPNPLW